MGTGHPKANVGPVIANAQLPETLRAHPCKLDLTGLGDELAKHLARLRALHPQLSVAFREKDLAKMTANERQMLLDDVNEVLGIAKT